MIDLHIHTTNSDGSFSTLDILKLAENIGLETISITDHNSIDAYDEISKINIKDYFSGRLINGCEIKCKFGGLTIEVLAYDLIDLNILSNWLQKYFSKEDLNKNQVRQLQYLKKVCDKLGLKYDEKLQISEGNPWAAMSLIFNLVKFEENKNYFGERIWDRPHLFYREYCCAKSSPFFVDETLEVPDIKEVIDIVTVAGGKTFLAHVFEYPIENYAAFLENLIKDTDISGLECYHSSFTDEQIAYLIKFCNENNLLISGGTDFHGEGKPNVDLGIGQGNLNIPNSVLEEWG